MTLFFLCKWKSLQQGFALCPVLSVMDSLEPIVWASLLLQLSACKADIYHHQLIVSEEVPYAYSSWQIHLSLSHCKASPKLLSLHGNCPSMIFFFFLLFFSGGFLEIVSGLVLSVEALIIFSVLQYVIFLAHMQCKKLCTQESLSISLLYG